MLSQVEEVMMIFSYYNALEETASEKKKKKRLPTANYHFHSFHQYLIPSLDEYDNSINEI